MLYMHFAMYCELFVSIMFSISGILQEGAHAPEECIGQGQSRLLP